MIDKKKLDAAHKQVVEAMETGNFDTLRKMIDPDKVGGKEGVDEVIESLKAFSELKPDFVEDDKNDK